MVAAAQAILKTAFPHPPPVLGNWTAYSLIHYWHYNCFRKQTATVLYHCSFLPHGSWELSCQACQYQPFSTLELVFCMTGLQQQRITSWVTKQPESNTFQVPSSKSRCWQDNPKGLPSIFWFSSPSQSRLRLSCPCSPLESHGALSLIRSIFFYCLILHHQETLPCPSVGIISKVPRIFFCTPNSQHFPITEWITQS